MQCHRTRRLSVRVAGRIVLCLVLATVSSSAQISIFRPKIGVPAFPLIDGTFAVEIEAAPGLASNAWGAVLANDLRAWTCSVERVDYGAYVHCNSATGYLLTVRAPADIAPEVFNLAVRHASGGDATNRHCVKPLRAYETNFYILHYADPQVETENATAANGAGGSHGSVQAMHWAASAYSLINPRFMFNTGDEVENGMAALYPKYLEAINTLQVPLLITRGNNDAQGSYSDWKRDLGQSTFSLTMGSFYVGMKDYETNDNLSWFTNDYAASFTNPAITFHLLGQHFNSGSFAYSPPAGQYPDLMLVGHNHSFSTLSTNPYYVLSSGPGWDYGAVGIFEFHRNGGGWVCSNKTIHGAGNKLQVYGDWGQPCRVTNTFLYPNDGTALSNTTFITNGLAYDFWDGQVRFLMRRSECGYAVSGGETIAAYDYTATNTAVLVKVNIRASALTLLSVCPISTNKLSQLITFPAIPDQNVTSTVSLAATASSGLPVSFSVGAGPGLITGGSNLTFSATGRVSIAANQAGNSNWNAAPGVTNSFNVTGGTLPVPQNLAASAGRYADKVALSWSAVSGAPGYAVWRHTADDSSGATQIAATSDTHYADTSAAGGTIYYYWVQATNAAATSAFSSSASGWRRSVGFSHYADVDIDGDRKADLVIFNPLTGSWRAKLSGSGYAEVSGVFGGADCTLVPGDYDGDRMTDPGIYAELTGLWTVMLSSMGYAQASATLGGMGYAPVPGDFDGDRKTDPGVYQSSSGGWTVKLSASDYAEAGTTFGGSGYLPVQRDYDGDIKYDPAIYNTTNGNWRVMLSGSGYGVATALGFGGTGYAPVVGDYDGDGRADPAIYEEASGKWQVMLSASGYLMASGTLGGTGYAALPGDYDGDGKTDPAVYNLVSGELLVMLSGSGYGIATTVFDGEGYDPVGFRPE